MTAKKNSFQINKSIIILVIYFEILDFEPLLISEAYCSLLSAERTEGYEYCSVTAKKKTFF